MNGHTFRGSNSVIFIVVSHINWGHLKKERIAPIGRVDTIWGGFLVQVSKQEVTKIVSFQNLAEKAGGVLIHLKILFDSGIFEGFNCVITLTYWIIIVK